MPKLTPRGDVGFWLPNSSKAANNVIQRAITSDKGKGMGDFLHIPDVPDSVCPAQCGELCHRIRPVADVCDIVHLKVETISLKVGL